MKKKFLLFFNLSVLCAVLLFAPGCGNDIEKVDFVLNDGQMVETIAPDGVIDPSKAFKVFVGDTIHFLDATAPEGIVKTLSWTLTMDSLQINKSTDVNPLSIGFEGAGLYQMRLCVNGAEDCATKLVLVEERPMPTVLEVEQDHGHDHDAPATDPPPSSSTHSSSSGKNGNAGTPNTVQPPAPTKPSLPDTTQLIAIVEPPKRKLAPSLRSPNTISASVTAHPSNSECTDFKETSFSVTLRPSKRVQLGSFRLFHDGCGGLNLSLKGGDIDESTTEGLSGRTSQILFEGMNNPILEPGQSYVLSGSTIAKYGSCSGDRKPRIEDAKDCNLPVSRSALLEMNQNGHLFIYELKFQN